MNKVKNMTARLKKSLTKRRIIVSSAVVGGLAFIVLAGVSFGLFAPTSSHNDAPTKLSSSSAAKPSTTSPVISSPKASPQSSSTTTKSTAPITSTPTSTSNQAAIQLQCGINYGNYAYTYSQSVINDASKLGSAEGSLYSQALQQSATSPDALSNMLTEVNDDIDGMNTNISSNWNTYFVIYKQLPGCNSSQPNIPSLLQVPQCDATSLNSFNCISQIDPSLDIGS